MINKSRSHALVRQRTFLKSGFDLCPNYRPDNQCLICLARQRHGVPF